MWGPPTAFGIVLRVSVGSSVVHPDGVKAQSPNSGMCLLDCPNKPGPPQTLHPAQPAPGHSPVQQGLLGKGTIFLSLPGLHQA